MRILAIDPGRTTGYALVIPPLDILDVGEISKCQANDPRIPVLLQRISPTEVVVESFRLYPGTKGQALGWDDLLPSQLISMVNAWCADNQVYYVEQQPSAKQAVSDKVLKAVGGFVRGKPHARDAVKHAIHRAWWGYDYICERPVVEVLTRLAREVDDGELSGAREGD